ncbi:apoptosis-inducing factor 3-like isoform X1 [Brachionus plicatilis]|uniref:Apoptosis-inducing factor 3-like isoform X1 n=1 Tax=Brachionus plicatilis TaxID=10195 RepID=A0A3M7SZ63_BRAPC|nr:apoptosis-inducing factor 3-like isoform X1 [Brachionus plicatilis]
MSDRLEFKLCNQIEIEDNSMKEFEIDLGQEKKSKVLLIRQKDAFYCLAPKCSHYQVPLVNGVLIKDRLRCFAHGACFNIKTGDIEDYPGPDCVPKYEVFLDGQNDVFIRATKEELLTTKRLKQMSKVALRSDCAKQYPKCLIIGSGAAGIVCADTLREAGFENVVLLTKENCMPYDRPKLSKALNLTFDEIRLRKDDYFSQNGIKFCPNEDVEKIDFDHRKVFSSSGNVFDYDRLVIATGLRANPIPKTKGSDLKGIFTLRSFKDAQEIIEFFNNLNNDSHKPKIVLVGGSFISMELAAFFADKAQLTILSRLKPYENVFGTLVSSKVQKLHESKGIKFRIGSETDICEYTESAVRSGQVGLVKLKDNSELECDLCLVAIGGQPVTDFLTNSQVKLSLNNFVYVDKHMRTSVPNVYAAGDIAHFPKACLSGLEFSLSKNQKLDHVNIGHWGLASSLGRTAALSIVSEYSDEYKDKEISLRIVPFFWSSQHNKNIRFAGYNSNFELVIFHEDSTKQNEYKFAAFYILLNRVVAVCTLDWDPLCALFAEAMYNKIEVRREQVEKDPMENMKKLLASV